MIATLSFLATSAKTVRTCTIRIIHVHHFKVLLKPAKGIGLVPDRGQLSNRGLLKHGIDDQAGLDQGNLRLQEALVIVRTVVVVNDSLVYAKRSATPRGVLAGSGREPRVGRLQTRSPIPVVKRVKTKSGRANCFRARMVNLAVGYDDPTKELDESGVIPVSSLGKLPRTDGTRHDVEAQSYSYGSS